MMMVREKIGDVSSELETFSSRRTNSHQRGRST